MAFDSLLPESLFSGIGSELFGLFYVWTLGYELIFLRKSYEVNSWDLGGYWLLVDLRKFRKVDALWSRSMLLLVLDFYFIVIFYKEGSLAFCYLSTFELIC